MTRCCSMKVGRGGDEAVELDDAADAGEIAAERGLGLGENVDGAEFGGALACRDIDAVAEMAGDGDLAVFHRQLAGDIEMRSADDEGHIVGGRRGGLRQGDSQFLEACFDFDADMDNSGHCCVLLLNAACKA